MTYSNFTMETVEKEFELDFVEHASIFAEIEPVELSAELTNTLARNVPLATTINTEKARSELIVSNVLVELREQFDRKISLFSGIDFNVDVENGLTGVCDFLISLSPRQSYVEAPVIALVEAKNLDLKLGLGQCAAEMLAAQQFNAEKGNEISYVYGASTTGVDWLFLKLEGKCLQLDMSTYQIAQCDRILGIFSSMVAQKA